MAGPILSAIDALTSFQQQRFNFVRQENKQNKRKTNHIDENEHFISELDLRRVLTQFIYTRFTSNEIDLVDLIVSESKTVLQPSGINYFKRFKVEEVIEFLRSILDLSNLGVGRDDMSRINTMASYDTMRLETGIDIQNLVDA